MTSIDNPKNKSNFETVFPINDLKDQEKVSFEYLTKDKFSHFLYRGEKALDAVL